MMNVLMPQLGETVTQGTVVSWHKKEGDQVSKDEILADVETDKAAVEIPAPSDGVISSVLVQEGETVDVGTVLVVINGPDREQLGMCGTFNVLGSSDRATTVIGRAIRLILCNLLDARPGDLDRSTLGHPGKFSYCIAEDEEHTEWLSLAEDRAMPTGTSTVPVMAAGSPRQIMNEWTTEP